MSEISFDVKKSCEGCGGKCCYHGELQARSQAEMDYILSVNPGALVGRDNWVSWVGACGNLDVETGECTDYENAPYDCKKFVRGGEDCVFIQDSPPVDWQPPVKPFTSKEPNVVFYEIQEP